MLLLQDGMNIQKFNNTAERVRLEKMENHANMIIIFIVVVVPCFGLSHLVHLVTCSVQTSLSSPLVLPP
jgi:hypothetical protein